MTHRSVRVLVKGTVQGVGFRWFVSERARRLGLTGWVRNLPDGTVELEATGENGAIETLVEQLREGPPRSAVADVQVYDHETPLILPSPFQIRR